MTDQTLPAKLLAGFELMVAGAQGDARKLAALSVMALRNGSAERAYALAREARALAPDDTDIRSMTQAPIAAQVPSWHFRIVRDDERNNAWEAALRRAVRPDSRVLDIGTGTGILAMMAARAGAAHVIACEMNPAVAGAAKDVVALNGYADHVTVVPKRSTELDTEADMGGRADILVSEIVSNDLLSQNALAVMTDAVDRLLQPAAAVIPASGRVRVALAWWDGLDARRLGAVAGFDMEPFNALDRLPFRLKAGDPGLHLRSAPADLFDFDFSSGGPYAPASATRELHADGGRINGVVQWIHLSLDAEGSYENKPAPGASSCWAVLFNPLQREYSPQANEPVRVHGAHTLDKVRIWTKI